MQYALNILQFHAIPWRDDPKPSQTCRYEKMQKYTQRGLNILSSWFSNYFLEIMTLKEICSAH